MKEVRAATRLLATAVIINILIVLVGQVTGGGLLVKFIGADGLAGPLAPVGEIVSSIASMLVMGLVALLGIGPSFFCNLAGGVFLCRQGAPSATRRSSTISLVLFCLAILLIFVVGLIPSEDFSGLRRSLRIIALVLAVGSHASFLAVLRKIARDQLGFLMESLFWSTLGLCAITCLLVVLAWCGWLHVLSGLGLFVLCGFYLVWNGCYLAVLLQLASRT